MNEVYGFGKLLAYSLILSNGDEENHPATICGRPTWTQRKERGPGPEE
jgi:hypothetical protein